MIPVGWSVRGSAPTFRLFDNSVEAYAYAAKWGWVRPVYHGDDIPKHTFTSDGPGVIGADNCQVCGRWFDEPETPICGSAR